jgi:tRNA pseudouridine38-40 synthase
MTSYKIVLAYDGTDFRGWQRQPGERTVQGALEDAVFKITRKRTAANGAGRTDAGVHARGQVAHFRVVTRLKDEDLFRALNAVLPWDIRILHLERAGPDFHARKSARSKVYEYRIVHAPRVAPFDFRYALHWPYPLDLRAMRAAAPLFVRKADFTAFSSNRERIPVRTVRRSEIRKKGDEVIYTIEADGFLRYMVRTIVGTLLEVGRGKLAPGDVEEIFRRKDRLLAGPTAPAKGLCLVRVGYKSRTRPIR